MKPPILKSVCLMVVIAVWKTRMRNTARTASVAWKVSCHVTQLIIETYKIISILNRERGRASHFGHKPIRPYKVCPDNQQQETMEDDEICWQRWVWKCLYFSLHGWNPGVCQCLDLQCHKPSLQLPQNRQLLSQPFWSTIQFVTGRY